MSATIVSNYFSDSRRSRKSTAKKDPKDSDSNSKSKDQDGKNKSKNNGSATNSNNADQQDQANKSGSGSGKDNAITEADVKVEPSKDGRRTPLHARDMEPVSFDISSYFQQQMALVLRPFQF